ncbi:MAG TPA: rhodanese-like domain-containing protein [Candidatus Thiothrix moscowensis]|uniref:rhodanese-like domain-containing protein n=1 Tax=unclassified Thiothrix TaxID=2636184 RepID=UPI0025DE7948|nr:MULTISPECIES: rhodanese-like domain-containing protein [unclassified Thiothrix]HRJ53233.1 rhodanese-like domain-containing protein [Candidatus Thiothrix moscowensis]HRJ93197.1 rhodanese-like domain-containing protein [Candidatus Thiothrix moscowensis]
MTQKTFAALVAEALPKVSELMPWDVEEMLATNPELMLVDIREADEYAVGHIQNSLLVPRGILETACDWGYSETIPELVMARDKPVVLICRSGNRTALAALTMQLMGYQEVYSMKTGIRGWNDYELPLYNDAGEQVDIDEAEEGLNPAVRPEQIGPKF